MTKTNINNVSSIGRIKSRPAPSPTAIALALLPAAIAVGLLAACATPPAAQPEQAEVAEERPAAQSEQAQVAEERPAAQSEQAQVAEERPATQPEQAQVAEELPAAPPRPADRPRQICLTEAETIAARSIPVPGASVRPLQFAIASADCDDLRHPVVATDIAISPDGRYAASDSDGAPTFYDLQTGAAIGSRTPPTTPTTTLISTLRGHRENVLSVAISPDGSRALSGSLDDTLKYWDLETGALISTLSGHKYYVWSVAISPDGSRALSGSDDHTLKYWDLETGALISTLFGHRNDVWSVAISPDGSRALSGSWDHTLKYWDLETGALISTLSGHTSDVNSVAISPDGSHALSGSWDTTLKYWNLRTRSLISTLRGHNDRVYSVAFSPDGSHALSGSADDTLKYWNLQTGSLISTLRGHNDRVYSVAISPDGSHALSGSWDTTLKYWNLRTRSLISTLRGHNDWVLSVAISPDGSHALSGSDDKTLKYWNLRTRSLISTLRGHNDWVLSVAISPDGSHALSGSYDNTLKYWAWASSTLAEYEIATLREYKSWTQHATALISTQGRAPSGGDALALLSRRVGELRREALHVPLVRESNYPLPPAEDIPQNPFETLEQFNLRVAEIEQRRDARIASIQARYRRAVEARNREVERRREQWEAERTGAIATVFSQLFGTPTITPLVEGQRPKYDPNTRRLFATLSWSGAEYYDDPPFTGEIVIEGLQAGFGLEASQAFTGLQEGSLDYRIIYRVDGNDISLDVVEFDWDNDRRRYAAHPDDGSGVKIDALQRITFDTSEGVGAELAQLQDATLEDSDFIEKREAALQQFYTDDIPELLAGIEPAEPNDNLWLFAIGIEDYEETDDINFSKRSAELFVKAARKKLGIPKHQTFALYDEEATSTRIDQRLKVMLDRMQEAQAVDPEQRARDLVQGTSREQTLLFYYSGHGVPDISQVGSDGKSPPYIMPVDSDPRFVGDDDRFKLDNLYLRLSESPATQVVAFMDSCFTARTDNKSVFGGETGATALAPREVTFDKRTMAIITAGTDSQFSTAYREKGHRLFSYHVIRELLEGHDTVDQLYRQVSAAVSRVSRESQEHGGVFKQDPVLEGNGGLRF